MSAKAILVFCAHALLIQGIYSQCAGISPAYAAEDYGFPANALAYGAGYSPYTASGLAPGFAPGLAPAGYANCGFNAPASGGGFAVISTSPIAPTGITVISENAIEGALSIAGELPFLAAVALEGALPTAGAGAINYGCGNGAVGIVSEGIAPVGPAYPGGFGPAGYGPAGYAPAGLAGGVPFGGLGYGGRGFGLGCGAVY